MKNKIIALFFILFSIHLYADEGMWIPLLVEQQILPAMHEAGCKLSAEDIYSANKACLTNTVVRIGRGCSGSFISSDGLILTNYHCVQYQITKACEGGINYLNEGFFAKNSSEELPTARLSIETMYAMYDVTSQVAQMKSKKISLKEITDSMTIDSTKEFQYIIEEFYGGNQYFMFKTKKYTDIRLVAFMPAEIAQFGNNADNWNWPRNNADFAILRAYENDKPVQPRKFLKINKNGVKEDDFAMVMGFPAETKMYGTKHELDLIENVLNPAQIEMREYRLQPIVQYMKKGDKEYHECYAIFSSLSNYYEKWKAENKGIASSGALEFRQERENTIKQWIEASDSLSKQYNQLFDLYDSYATKYYDTYTNLVLYLEGIWRLRTFLPSSIAVSSPNLDFIRSQKFLDIVKKYNPELERTSLLPLLKLTESQENKSSLSILKNLQNEENQDIVIQKFLDSVFNKSVFTDYIRAEAFQKMITSKKKFKNDSIVRVYLHKNDALYRLSEEIWTNLQMLSMAFGICKQQFDSVQCSMNKALCTYYNGTICPDANNTMRISYGKIKPYSIQISNETIHYPFYTTSDRIFEKLNENPREYKTNEKFLSLLQNKDFGSFEKDSLIMNFITTCQTSGGNSGSPVIDAKGNLIGLNFDRNREGTVSDFYYTESVCRNICVDIRYILFCLEKYGNATNILQELSFAE